MPTYPHFLVLSSRELNNFKVTFSLARIVTADTIIRMLYFVEAIPCDGCCAHRSSWR